MYKHTDIDRHIHVHAYELPTVFFAAHSIADAYLVTDMISRLGIVIKK